MKETSTPQKELLVFKDRADAAVKERRNRFAPIFRDIPEILRHTVAFVAAILSIWFVHLVLENLLGKDARFYDKLPVRYVVDTGHLAVFIRYIWQLARQIWRRS